MTGSRLSSLEKARLFATNGAFFGVPAATGLFGYPFGDNIRNYARENGYVIGDKFLSSVVMEGVPAMIAALISGGGDFSKGNWYNIGGRYGAQGIGTLEDLTDGDKTTWQIFGGAAYSTLSNTWAQSSGLRMAMMQAIRGEGDFKLTVDDAVGPFKEISSFSQLDKAIAGVRFGTWLNKSGATMYPTSPMNAIFQAASGLSEQRATDTWQISQTLKADREFDNKLYGQFQKEFTLATQAINNGDQEGGTTHFKNAFAYFNQFGYPVERIPEAIASAIKNNQSIIEREKYNFYVKNARTRNQEAYERDQAIREGRGE